MRKKSLIGQRFGKLITIKDIGSKQEGKRKFRWWLCKCDCGKFTKIRAGHLIAGQISCGCQRKLPKGESAFNSLHSGYQRNAKIRNLSFELNKKQFRRLTQEPCFYCNNEPFGIIEIKKQNGIFVYNGVDRINNSIGYIKKNCVACCKTCNWMKNTMSYEEFIIHIKKIYTVSSVA